MNDRQIVKTQIMVTVLSDGPLELSYRDDDPFGLLALNYQICEGSCLGSTEEISCDVLEPGEVEDALVSMGNDGSFFDWDDDV